MTIRLFTLLLIACLALGQNAIFVKRGRTDGGSGIFPRGDHQRIDSFTANGTWTAPAGVTSAVVEAWAGGGGANQNVGAGGGGEYCRATVAVTPSTGYAVVRGAGGTATNAGGNSTFDATVVVAVGGAAGATGTGGTGGTGDACFDGGAGSNGTGNRRGGGGAGSTEAGDASSGDNDGLGGDFFGGRGQGVGVLGTIYSGGGRSSATTQTSGAPGLVRVSYEIDPGDGYPVIPATGRAYGRGGDVTSHVITLPACSAGQLLLVLFAMDGSSTLDAVTDGWTILAQDVNGTAVRGAVLYRTAAGSDALTITSSAAQESSHIALCIEGATAAPTATVANGSSGDSDPPSNTHAGGAGSHLWIVMRAGDDANMGGGGTQYVVLSGPSGYSDFLYLSPVTRLGADIAMATRHLGAADTEDPGTFTSISEQWVTATITVPGELDP
jgi:hypothetical protein